MFKLLSLSPKKVKEAEDDILFDELQDEMEDEFYIKSCGLCGKEFLSNLPPHTGRLICYSPKCIAEYEDAEKLPPIIKNKKKYKELKTLIIDDEKLITPTEWEIHKKIGFVYLMCSETGLYKIGRSKAPSNRMKELNKQFPVKIWLIHFFKSNVYIQVEKYLHDKFSIQRKGDEWFSLSQKDIDWFCSLADHSLDNDVLASVENNS